MTNSTPTLFQPLHIRDVKLSNRLIVSPMCQYLADKGGHATDYHLVHVGQFALSGASLIIVEATAVEARGRNSPHDLGLWADSQITPLRRMVNFIHSQGQKAGIQLAHTGRKASTLAPWLGQRKGQLSRAFADDGGWPDNVVAPSAIPFAEGWHEPRALSLKDIKDIVAAFADSARRAVEAGFDIIEIHGAYGYLLNEFLSPLTNRRTDEYGGSFENRTRFLLEVVKAVRAVIPNGMPLFVRVSATEWMEHIAEPGQVEQTWDLAQTIRLAKLLPDLGVDLLDVVSGGNTPAQRIDSDKYAQVRLAGRIREAVQKEAKTLLLGAGGMISEANMAKFIVQQRELGDLAGIEEEKDDSGQGALADAVLIGREFLRDPRLVLNFARDLGVQVPWPNQYHMARVERGDQV